MYLKLLTGDNAFIYSSMIPDAFLRREELLGVVCLDEEDTPQGIAVVEPRDEDKCLNIQWLYVLPTCRRGGVGSLLLEGISEIAEAAGLETVDIYYWTAEQDESESLEEEEVGEDPAEEDTGLLSYEFDSFIDCDELSDRESLDYWNTGRESIFIDAFLMENGFVILRENQIYSFYLSDILTSEYVSRHNKNKDNDQLKAYTGISFDGISSEDEIYVVSQLKKQGFPDYTPFCRRDISFICKKDENPAGCILITDNPDERTLTVMALQNFGTDPVCAAKLIVLAGSRVLEELPSDYKVSFVLANEGVQKFWGTILDDMSKLKMTGVTSHAVFEV
ncbi:MAG: GNAT family N-acetyltransferase [Butyrivibrio sp.]|nr:GNAT family N-acetyltransferase [Butyrivibrio sp.]